LALERLSLGVGARTVEVLSRARAQVPAERCAPPDLNDFEKRLLTTLAGRRGDYITPKQERRALSPR